MRKVGRAGGGCIQAVCGCDCVGADDDDDEVGVGCVVFDDCFFGAGCLDFVGCAG